MREDGGGGLGSVLEGEEGDLVRVRKWGFLRGDWRERKGVMDVVRRMFNNGVL